MSDRLTPAQIRGARGMLDWSMAQLADAARLSVSTVKRMETAGPQPVSDDVYERVREALEAAGVTFLGDDGTGVGVRLRRPQGEGQDQNRSPLIAASPR